MRILFVGPPGSVHAARWANQLTGIGWDVHFFASIPSAIRPEFKGLTIYGVSVYRPPGLDPSVRLRGFWPLRRGAWHVALPFRRFSPLVLASLIRRLRPDVVHSLGVQHGGYLTLEARERLLPTFPPWVVSNWGSDIHFFGRKPEHEARIRSVMSACDYVQAECERDIRLAREFGFGGEMFRIVPCGGGFDLEQMKRFRQPGPPSARRVIVVKGMEGGFGRGLVALRALELCAEELRDYRAAVTLASPEVEVEARRVQHETGISIDVESQRWPRDYVLALHGRSKIFVGIAVSEGANTSMLEALVLGSFPIQSCTACADEWLVDGQSGLIVPPDDPEAIAGAIRRALSDDDLIDTAAELNEQVVAERLDERIVRPLVVSRYREVVDAGRS